MNNAHPSDRSVGLVFGVIFILTGVFQAWKGRILLAFTLTTLAILILVVCTLRPTLLGPMNRAWTKLGGLLHHIVSPIVLFAIYFLVITPFGLVMRALGNDPMRKCYEPEALTYWIDRTPPGPPADSLPNQF